jgi:hypothetical protein
MDVRDVFHKVVWMRTVTGPARAFVKSLHHERGTCVGVILSFDDPAYHSDDANVALAGRLLYLEAFWSALDHVEGA